jgi:hypothetical protein
VNGKTPSHRRVAADVDSSTSREAFPIETVSSTATPPKSTTRENISSRTRAGTVSLAPQATLAEVSRA